MSTKPTPGATSSMPAHSQLEQLFDAHAARLYRLARRLTPSADDALDLVQETFLKVARTSAPVPSGPGAEEAWLVRILMNTRRDQWRRECVRRRHASRLGDTTTEQPNPEPLYVLQATIWRALDSLPPRRRAILVMHELEGLPPAHIAALLGITSITVRWHLARARRELARQLRPKPGAAHGHTDSPLATGRPTASRGAARP